MYLERVFRLFRHRMIKYAKQVIHGMREKMNTKSCIRNYKWYKIWKLSVRKLHRLCRLNTKSKEDRALH